MQLVDALSNWLSIKKVHEESYIEACYVVNLNDLDYSLGIYGVKAKQAFLDRVVVYSN